MKMKMPSWFRASSADVQVVVVIGVLVILTAVVELIRRLIEVVPNRDVRVALALDGDMSAGLPLGPAGKLVDVEIGEMLVTVSGLPPGTYVGVLGAAVVGPVVAIVVAVLGIGLCRALLRGDVFIPANTLRVNLIAAAILGGALLHTVFATFRHNGVLAALAGSDDVMGLTVRFEYLPWLAGFALAAFAMAFNVGERMQRDTEGLV
jgi:hypothetical protein